MGFIVEGEAATKAHWRRTKIPAVEASTGVEAAGAYSADPFDDEGRSWVHKGASRDCGAFENDVGVGPVNDQLRRV